MDEIIIKEMIKNKVKRIGLLLCSAAILIFCIIGISDECWVVPAKRAEIVKLTGQRDIWQARAKSLDKYIETREGQYRVAVKFDRLFFMAADPNRVMDFEAIEELIKDRKGFYVKNINDK